MEHGTPSRTAIIGGGAGGIGVQIVRKLAARGGRIVTIGSDSGKVGSTAEAVSAPVEARW